MPCSELVYAKHSVDGMRRKTDFKLQRLDQKATGDISQVFNGLKCNGGPHKNPTTSNTFQHLHNIG